MRHEGVKHESRFESLSIRIMEENPLPVMWTPTGPQEDVMNPSIPAPLEFDHEKIESKLAMAIKEEGAIGDVARQISEQLVDHLKKEEEFAFPPLGALDQVVLGKDIDPEPLIRTAEMLRARLPRMYAEHQEIVRLVDVMAEAAVAAGRHEYVELARELRIHTCLEEEILYPAAILLGDYLRLKMELEELRVTQISSA